MEAQRSVAATHIQSIERGRRSRRHRRLHSLAARVQQHYLTHAATTNELDDALLGGAVRALEDRLFKLSGLVWQLRSVRVDDWKFMYHSKHGETKTIGVCICRPPPLAGSPLPLLGSRLSDFPSISTVFVRRTRRR